MAGREPIELVRANFWEKIKLWLRLEFGAFKSLQIKLAAFEGELGALDAGTGPTLPPWRVSVDRLLKAAHQLAVAEPQSAWACYTTAERLALRSFETGARAAEVNARAVELLSEAVEKAGKWRADAIKKILADDNGKVRANVGVIELERAQRVLDEHHQNVHRKVKALRKRLRVMEIAGVAVIGGWLALWPIIGLLSLLNNFLWDWSAAFAIALMGFTGVLVSAFSSAKGLSDSRLPVQDAEYAITIARFVSGWWRRSPSFLSCPQA